MTSLALNSLIKPVASLWKGRVERDGYRDQIVTRLHSVMWVCMSLLSKTHPQFMEHSNGSVMHARFVSCTFSTCTIPIFPFQFKDLLVYTTEYKALLLVCILANLEVLESRKEEQV